MYQGSGLQSLPWFLLGQLLGRKLPQLVVHQRQQLARSVGVASIESVQDPREVRHGDLG
jgi:hypothetical protein